MGRFLKLINLSGNYCMNGKNYSCSELLSILKALPDRVFILSESGKFLDAFGGVDTEVTYTTDSIVGLNLEDILNKSKASEFLTKVTEALETQKTQHYLYSFTPDNFPTIPDITIPETTQWYESRIQPLTIPIHGQTAVVWITRNITSNQEHQDRLIELSEHDDLTQLLNRRAFSMKLNQCFGCVKRNHIETALLIIDIDHFKLVNDTYGHLFGDEVIRSVANILKDEVRDIGNVGRIGGEEFAILLKNTGINDAHLFASQICKKIEEHHFTFNSDQTRVTVSIGVSKVSRDDVGQNDVFHRADKALYESKSKGRNRVTINCIEMDYKQ